MLSEHWHSVRTSAPCPICGKPDWCQVSADGRAAICRRISSNKPTKGGGWYHRRDDGGGGAWSTARLIPPRPSAPAAAPTRQDLDLLVRQFATSINPSRLQRFAQDLGVTVQSLERLDVGWSIDRKAWSFPMRDADNGVRGIRMRALSGRKFAIAGGREGLFMPRGVHDSDRLFVCEGPTDTAALLDLGFAAIGRPSCMGGVQHVVDVLKARHRRGATIGQLVIVADDDVPGRRGAEQLAGVARVYCSIVQIVTPPAGVKDARAWKGQGATAADVERAVWAAPRKQLRVVSSLEGVCK